MQKFEFEGAPVRITDKDGEPWFVAKDICAALGISDTRQAVERLESDEWCLIPLVDKRGRKQEMFAVSEPGMYSLVLRSDKAEAKAFKRWVIHEVLPVIRKTGKYEHIPKSLRIESKDARNGFTATLKKHGYTDPKHYSSTTRAMKRGLGIDENKKKDTFGLRELVSTTFAEMLAQDKIAASAAYGYYSVKPIAVESAESVKLLLDQAKAGAPRIEAVQ